MINKNLYRKLGWSIISASYIVLSSNSLAAPGTLPVAPLFLSNAAEPNIFLTLDDSGSMESETMVSNETAESINKQIDPDDQLVKDPINVEQSELKLEDWFRYYMFPIDSNGRETHYLFIDSNGLETDLSIPYELTIGTETLTTHINTVPSTNIYPDSWVLRNSTGNKLYYNPDIDYTPWINGKDSSGNDYQNAPTEAWIDPNNKDFGVFNLITEISYWAVDYKTFEAGSGYYWQKDTMYPATYYEWTDTNNDGIIQLTEPYEAIEIRSTRNSYPSGRTYKEEIQNFANWFQYYRKRSFAAKAAMGNIISNTESARMGLELVSNSSSTTPTSSATSMTDPLAKDSLLNTLYQAGIYCGPGKNGTSDPDMYPDICHGTPSREALQKVGEMFKNTDPLVSPIQSAADGGECQQNFNIFMSDGYWNKQYGVSGKEVAIAGIGNEDLYSATNSFDGDASSSNDGGNYADSYSVTLADVAMYYYKNDLNADLANIVPTITGVDEASHQHLVTYTVGFGLKGTLDPETDNPVTGGSSFWPNPMNEIDERRVDDLWHAAYNGRGEYLDAQNPTELKRALSASITNITFRTATSAAVAVNSARLTSESVVYLAQFDSSEWVGNLYAFPIIDLDLGTLSATPKWEAGSVLTNRDLSSDPRQIITYDGSNGVPFQWNTTILSSAMLDDLRTSPAGGSDSDTIAEERLEYLRGDRSNEDSGLFRSRPSLLGDIVNAGPVFVGEASLNWPDVSPFPDTQGARYSDFKNGTPKTRAKVVYVGSNDGLLHAFDDSTGKELFAYAPNILASTDSGKGYHYLSDPNYGHNWYVDQTPTLSDVYMTTNNGSGWHTILVGGLRGGGRGLYALDVTNPSTLNETNADKVAMWEFSDANDSDLGYTYSRPAIAMGNDQRWYAIFGNGYNDNGSGEAQLFIVDIESGIDNTWALGTNYYKISTGVGSVGGLDADGNPVAERNGLATPALADVDGNGTVDRVYAGDLQGNMWVFDLSGTTPGSWGAAYLAGQDPVPLFTTAANQPITVKPVLARHLTMPDSSSPDNSPNLMVLFGTGQYLVNADKTDTSAQAFYGVWDDGTSALNPVDNLVNQTYNSDYSHRVLNRSQVDYEFKHGWWISLPDSGERVVTTAIARHTEVFFNTFVPVTDSCSVGGYGYKFAVDIDTGGSPKETIIDVNEDGEINESDNENGTGVIAAVRQEGYLPEPVFIEDLVFTGSKASKIKKLPYVPSGRFSWQELIK